MTRQTALALIRRLDLNRLLAQTGRLTGLDCAATQVLWHRIDVEDGRMPELGRPR